ncbi:MAG: hypothetical protein IT430_03900 [Phycisphaerales bacterium]|nr:hypothetical protein [Phycisphaerales bacterium]
MREQTAADQRAAVLATGDAGSVPREIIRLECPTCETIIGPQAVVECGTGRAASTRIRVGWQLVAQMATYCPHCKVIILFNLNVDEATGRLLTRPVNGRRILRGAATIDRFLDKYPQCRGVVS